MNTVSLEIGKQPVCNAHLEQFKSGYKAVIDVHHLKMTHSAKWYKTEEEARKESESVAWKQFRGATLKWQPTIDKRRA